MQRDEALSEKMGMDVYVSDRIPKGRALIFSPWITPNELSTFLEGYSTVPYVLGVDEPVKVIVVRGIATDEEKV
jgi:hypothetical protein